MAKLEDDSFMPVAVETLLSPSGCAFDLYLRQAREDKPVLYRKQSYSLEPQDLKALREHGIRTLYISSASLDDYQEHLKKHVLTDESAPCEARLCALQEVNRALFLGALSGHSVDKVLDLSNAIGKEMSQVVAGYAGIAHNLFAVLNHDYCTFTHLTNVAVYSVLLAKHLSIRDPDELAAIATGALLHDLGKRRISSAVLNKRGRLTDHETRLIRKHPSDGFVELAGRPDLSWAQLMMVYQHHERIDGLGYPVQIPGEEIHPWARICAIADVFDALTGCRVYLRPKSAAEAVDYLLENSKAAFDREMVACWKNVILQPS